MGEPDAGISCCAFDDGAAGVEQAEALSIFDDEEGGAVFYGAAGVLKFGFPEDVAAGFFAEALEADEWCLSNGYTCGQFVYPDTGGQCGEKEVPSMKPRCPTP